MFLHSGAGLHGHEYTTKRLSSDLSQTKQILLRSSMRQAHSEENRRFSTPYNSVKSRRGNDQSSPSPSRRPTSLPASARSASESARHRDHSVRFHDEPQISHIPTPLQSDDEESIAGSEITADSDVSSRRRRKQRLPRQSTKFALAHPAPGLRTKQRRLVQFRPKVLLQLQELGERRAVPAFDVVPSTQIAGSFILPVLVKRFPRMFRAKPDLGQNDLLLMRSENYTMPTPSRSGHDGEANEISQRDVLAVVSMKPQEGVDQAELTLHDGSTWTIAATPNGSYEMKKVDGSTLPLTGRWVRRLGTPRMNSMDSNSTLASQPVQGKLTFSILDPTARRHPIMGVLTPNSLEIYENYNTMSTSSSRYPPTKPFGNSIGIPQDEQSSHSAAAVADERKTIPVTEENKLLMLASGTWISLRHAGWPATANPKMARTISQCRNSVGELSARQSLSTQTDSRESSHEFKRPDGVSRSKSTNSTPPTQPPTRSLSAASQFMRKQQERLQRQQNSSQPGSIDGRATPESVDKPVPRRGPMTKLSHWLKNCFGGDGGSHRPKS